MYWHPEQFEMIFSLFFQSINKITFQMKPQISINENFDVHVAFHLTLSLIERNTQYIKILYISASLFC